MRPLKLVRSILTAALTLAFCIATAQQTMADDSTEFFASLQKAADQGNAQCQFVLGTHYFTGNGLPKDEAKAAEWFTKAALQGNTAAQVLLGSAYQLGMGVSKDYVMAYAWYNIAAATGDASAAKCRDEIASRLTPEKIAEAQKVSTLMIITPPAKKTP